MFTLEQIKDAHSKVQSGADFPAYIKALIFLGVRFYDTFVADGHSNYFGEAGYNISSLPKYEILTIAADVNAEQFKNDLKTHQQGKTTYLTFCEDAAKSGIEKWTVDIQKLTCTYYDVAENEILQERIPG